MKYKYNKIVTKLFYKDIMLLFKMNGYLKFILVKLFFISKRAYKMVACRH